MVIFKRKNNDEEFLTVLGEIRDQLKINNDEVITGLESKIADAKYSNDEELGVWANRVVELEKSNNQLIEKYNLLHNDILQLEKHYEGLIEKQEKMVDVMKLYTTIIKDFIKDNQVEVTVDIPKTKCDGQKIPSSKLTQPEIIPKIRKGDTITAYGKNWKNGGYINIKRIEYMDTNGKFKRNGKGQRYYNWDINTLIKLKRIIQKPKKYPTMLNIGEEIGFSATTTNNLGYHILNGDFDQYFNEWEQMQMKKTYGEWKPAIENNPEKRKEKGYC